MNNRLLAATLAASVFVALLGVAAYRGELWQGEDATAIQPQPKALPADPPSARPLVQPSAALPQRPAETVGPNPQGPESEPDPYFSARSYEEIRAAREADPLRPARTR